ncbi:CST complex subunit Ten1 [Thermoascus aurantiacus ATCC 26904]
MSTPLPTRRVFLSELPSVPVHSKVRFLGCVRRYDVSTGQLILEHNYPPPSSAAKNKEPPSVPVDINNLLEDLKAEDLRVGAWLNVLGYVRERGSERDNNPHKKGFTLNSPSIYIEAVMVFSAGAVRVGEYERILRDSHEVDRRVPRPS